MNMPLYEALERRRKYEDYMLRKEAKGGIFSSLWAGLKGAKRPPRGAVKSMFNLGSTVRANPIKSAFIASSPYTVPKSLELGGAMRDKMMASGTTIPKPTKCDLNARKAAKELAAIEAAEKEAEAKEKEKSRKSEEALKEGKEDPNDKSWIPGIDNTLTAGAGGGVAGATGGYFLGKQMGWDPITSSLVGGLTSATAAAALAHYLKSAKSDEPEETK